MASIKKLEYRLKTEAPISIIDATVWNYEKNNIRNIFSDAFIADFSPTVKFSANIDGDARITGSPRADSAIENSGFTRECISLISEILESEWVDADPISKDSPQASAPPLWPVSLSDPAALNENISQSSPSPHIPAALRAQAEAAAAIQCSSGQYFLWNWISSRIYATGYDRPPVYGITAKLVIFVDLHRLPCEPPEDLSLCSQYISGYYLYINAPSIFQQCIQQCWDPERRMNVFCRTDMNCY